MALSPAKIKKHAMIVAHQSFFGYFVRRNLVQAKHPLTSHVFPEATAIRSQIGGLETSLGTGLWQRLADELAHANGVNVLNAADFKRPADETCVKPLRALAEKGKCLDRFGRDVAKAARKNGKRVASWRKVEKGDGIDFYFEKCGVEYAVDIKTAQINAKNGRTFYETFVRWMIFRQLRKNGRVRFRPRLVIPYDAEFEKSGGKIDWWATYKGRAAPLERQDVWVGNEFWSELTDCTTAWKAIQEGFMEVSPALRPLYEPLLTKQIKVNDLKMLLEAYGVDRVATGRGGAALSRDCECGKSCALSVTALASIAKEPVRCRVKTCSQIVLDSSGVDWLRGAGGVRRA